MRASGEPKEPTGSPLALPALTPLSANRITDATASQELEMPAAGSRPI
jgi:hypothetical protein